MTSVASQIVVSGGGLALRQAVNAAPSGAVLIVAPGSYDGFTIDAKGLTILGDTVDIVGTIEIKNTQANQPVTLAGLSWSSAMPNTNGALLELRQCAGAVHVEEIVQPSSIGPGYPVDGVNARDCAQLMLSNCTIGCVAALRDCNTVVDSCTIESEDILGGLSTAVRAAIRLWSGSLQIAGASVVRGGDGFRSGPTQAADGNGIMVSFDAHLRVLDGLVSSGDDPGLAMGGHGIVSFQSTSVARIEPRATVFGSSGIPVLSAGTVATESMPALVGGSDQPGGILTATVATEVGDLVILAVGLPGPSIVVPGLQDPFWIDPVVHLFAVIGVQPVGSSLMGQVTVPGGNTFRGLRLHWGAACQGPNTGFQASNPVATIVR
ncbi:MAG: hypothetical protein NXI31_22265 [bacterium]|nr:hypothetical protein [bacterium]